MNQTMTKTPPKKLVSIKRGVFDTPLRILIYGPEKVGKSTFAAGAPNPIFIGAEGGTERLDVDRLQPENWEQTLGFVRDIADGTHEYIADDTSDRKTIVVDPLGWFEPMVNTVVTGSPTGNIDKWEGGFGKGANAACMHWRALIAGLERCWRVRGMHVICVGHAVVKTFANPEGPAYDRYELVLQKTAAGLFRQWADVVAYANREVSVKKAEGDAKARAVETGYRSLHLTPSAAYDAGSRLNLPPELPLGWDAFWGSVSAESGRAAEILAKIGEMSAKLTDPAITKYVTDFTARNKNNTNKLAELANRLTVKIEEAAHHD